MPPKFSTEEKVLCYHGPLLYEAKCTKIKKEASQYQYFIHYQGWNKNWDEWVTEARMLKQNLENMEKQKRLLASHVAQSKANRKIKKDQKDLNRKGSKGGSDSNSNSRASTPVGERVAPVAARSTKRSLGDDERSTSSRDDEGQVQVPVKEQTGVLRKKKRKKEIFTDPVFAEEVVGMKVVVELPVDLKYILCRDWDNVVNKKRLSKIPAKVTVTHIIDQYISHLSSTQVKPAKRSVAAEIVGGFGEYFNVALGSQLLYNLEKLQYKEDCESKGAVQPCDIYGSFHLLRLLVKIGEYISAGSFSDHNIKIIEENLEDFITYLSTNKSMFFMKKNYFVPSQDYVTKNSKLL